MDYEKNIARLNEILEKMQDEKLPLNSAVELYKEAKDLYEQCYKYLEESKGGVYKIQRELESFTEERMK